MKHLRQNNVLKECIVCSCPVDTASMVSMLGVHSFRIADLFSVNSMNFSQSLFTLPISGKRVAMA